MTRSFWKFSIVAMLLLIASTGCGRFGGDNNPNEAKGGQVVADPGVAEPVVNEPNPSNPNPNNPPPQNPPTQPTEEELKVTATSPTGGDTFVGTSVTVTVTFNRSLNSATVNNGSVKLLDVANAEVGGTVSLNDKVISFSPATPLSAGSNYTLTVTAVEDTQGKTLASPFTLSFTTRFKLRPPTFPGDVLDTVETTCPAKLEEDFEVEAVRAIFYTARVEDAGTNGAVRLSTLGSGSGYSEKLVTEEEARQSNILEQGNLFYTRSIPVASNMNLRSMDFKAMKIELNNGDAWYLGGVVVQLLKKGCHATDESDWTTVYFNPFVRSWVASDKPLTLSYDDAVAVFHTRVWGDDDANTDDDIYGGTPFETRNGAQYKTENTPMLDYGDTDDFEKNHVGYYGRTYFAMPQADSRRMRGSFSSLTEQDVAAGFVMHLEGTDGVHFQTFQAYLIKPIYKGGSHPFAGYQSEKFYGWLDDHCPHDYPLQACAGDSPEIPIKTFASRIFVNLGEEPSQKSVPGYMEWARQHDDPGQ